jgi:hypothetical protein
MRLALAAGAFLPVAGAVFFNWGVVEVTVVYAVETLGLVGSYAAVALFAQQPSRLDERDRTEIPLLPLPTVSVVPEQIEPPGLPPIRTENLHVVGVSSALLVLLVAVVGATSTGNLSPDPNRPVRGQVDLTGFVADTTAAVDPVVVTVAGGMALLQVSVVFQWYTRGSQHRQLSAYVVMQRANRIVVAYGLVGGLCYAVGSVALSVASVSTTAPLLGGFGVLKLYLEQQRVDGELSGERSRTAAWLVPTGR